MNRDQWSRVKRLFLEGLDVPPESRHEWLARVAADDLEVLRELESLLHAHDVAGPIVEDHATEPGQAEDSLAPGVRIGDYEIRREVGRGGMGIVYLAQDVNLGRFAALKALPTIAARDQTLLRRLRHEAQAAAAVTHPGVAMIYAFIESLHGNFIASEYIQGRTLREEMKRGPMDPARAVRLTIEIAEALCAAHDAQIIHRDLKPENVMVTPSGAVKVIDFGIARIENLDGRTTSPFRLQGTIGYMAPEQGVPELIVDHRADLYALGVMLAEMVLGDHPFTCGTDRLPAALQAITNRCLESNRERRYQSARDLAHALDNVSRAVTVVHPQPVRAADTPRLDRRTWWWQFHQGSGALIYWLMVIPTWYARELIGGATGHTLFYLTLAAVIPTSILRLHLWFMFRTNPAELSMQLRREHLWIAGGDALFVIALTATGLLVGDARMSLAVLLISVGLGSGIIALFVEPATTRGAFWSA